MRIISKFHDYYDTALGYGADPTLIYSRETREYNITKGHPFKGIITPYTSKDNSGFWQCRNWRADEFPLDIKLYVIGFCGKTYPLIRVYTKYAPSDNNYFGEHYYHNLEYIYSESDFRYYITTHYGEQGCKLYLNQERLHNRKLRMGWDSYINHQDISNFFKYYNSAPTETTFEELFRCNKTPIWIFKHHNYNKEFIIINPKLITYNFVRIHNAYAAFQEISMYLGGVLGNSNPPIPEVSNDDLIKAKGFDKYSFRKDKQK